MKEKAKDRFWAWFWRGKKKSFGQECHNLFKDEWSSFCLYSELVFLAGYRAGRFDAENKR